MGGDERVATALPLVAVAVDRDKGSQIAMKWAIENLITRDQTIILVHVNTKGGQDDAYKKEVITPFRCFCTRKTVSCKDVVLEDTDIAKAVVDFVQQAAIESLVVGSPLRSGFVRFKTTDTPTNISRGAPDFCTVYIISAKGKVSSVRNAIRSAPATSALRLQFQSQAPSIKIDVVDQPRSSPRKGVTSGEPSSPRARQLQDERESFRSPFTRGMYGYKPMSRSEADISFVSSGRPSIDRVFSPRMSNAFDDFDRSLETPQTPYRLDSDASSSFSHESFTPLPIDDVEAEIKRLRLELKQTMDMYSTACKEALTAKQKAMELHRWKMEEEQRLQEARLAEEAALAMVEKERAKCRVAMEAAEASKKIAELEAQKRMYAEMQALRAAEERKKAVESLPSELRYRKYRIEEIEVATDYFSEHKKIGEGGYGPVYKCYLDHTEVAVKVLRPEASQGRTQFLQEIEILSSIRHPNMVLLLGACHDYGCLVYEYMDNGSLEDRLFRRWNTPPIPWQHRFRIAAEIGTGLLFLHQTKPEPIVHRDLKPASILLDRNYVSKISEVGLARLVPPSVAENVTQYRMTSTAGTFCYIDPEYQQTAMLCTKSDIYSLGILLLQLVTGKPPMGLTHLVESSIERGEFEEVLDPTVPDWPVEDALSLAQLALKCTELRRKDRPDLATVVLPELNRLRFLGEGNMQHYALENKHFSDLSRTSSLDVRSGPLQSGFESSTSQSSVLSPTSSHASAP